MDKKIVSDLCIIGRPNEDGSPKRPITYDDWKKFMGVLLNVLRQLLASRGMQMPKNDYTKGTDYKERLN